MRHIILFFSLFITIVTIFAQKISPSFIDGNTVWVDSIMNKMTIEEKIGQLIMVTSIPEQGDRNEKQIQSWIRNQHVGGVLFLKTTPYELASRANKYQFDSKIPLFIAIDAENGLSFRMDSVVRYPHAIGLGSLAHDSLIYQMGREVGQQCKALGINLNFAPVADVNSNRNNPIINYRSFGENPHRVALKCWQYAKGMQDERIFVAAKHFPGHGNTAFDSHLTLPQINRDYLSLDSIDFYPFKFCIDSGINGIMSAHINLSKIDSSGRPATLSKLVMNDILHDSLGFNGLVFSDGMNMSGITKYFNEGEAAVEALKANVDVVEFVLNPDIVINAVLKSIQNNEISVESINLKCRKVLMAKKWIGLDDYKKTELSNLNSKMNAAQYNLTARKLYEQSITVIQNRDSILPLQKIDTLKIASLAIGKSNESFFQQALCKYSAIDQFYIGINASQVEISKVLSQLKNYNLVIAGVHETRLASKDNFKVTEFHKKVVNDLVKQSKTILAFFASPYALNEFAEIEKAQSVLLTYGENYFGQSYAAQLIFGAIQSTSVLPVSINKTFCEGEGITIKKNGRLKYTIPEEVGFNSELLKSKIDSFANFGIQKQIFPGCQVLIAKEGKVVFHECYGFHTYDSLVPLQKEHIYDWASVTKITGPLPIIMKLVEDSIITLDSRFSKYWPDFVGSNKEYFTFREVLTHQARLKSWIAFYLDLYDQNKEHRKDFIRDRPSDDFPIRVSENLYIHKDYKQKIYSEIMESELLTKKKYAYSDLAFYLMPDLISSLIGCNYENYLRKYFYASLGASTVCYNPINYFNKDLFVPTEYDKYFRKELVQGFVHDEGAAMLGGVSGNAGLFGSTNDLAKIMQFYLQKGSYGDFYYVKPQIVDEFTRIQYPENENRRGLGFDKPYIDNRQKKISEAYPAPAVSSLSYGHSGYTGTFVWADPQNKLLFIFMSNRVYPSRENTKITTLNFRPKLQQAIYDCENSFKYLVY